VNMSIHNIQLLMRETFFPINGFFTGRSSVNKSIHNIQLLMSAPLRIEGKSVLD